MLTLEEVFSYFIESGLAKQPEKVDKESPTFALFTKGIKEATTNAAAFSKPRTIAYDVKCNAL